DGLICEINDPIGAEHSYLMMCQPGTVVVNPKRQWTALRINIVKAGVHFCTLQILKNFNRLTTACPTRHCGKHRQGISEVNAINEASLTALNPVIEHTFCRAHLSGSLSEQFYIQIACQ